MPNKIKLIVGLANPGRKYKKTRHNLGAKYVILLAKKYKKKLQKHKNLFGYTCAIYYKKKKIHLLIPKTYINFSGISIIQFLKYHKIKPKEMLVVHDELNFPPGTIKIKFGGNKHKHNGLKHIQYKINNKKFYQLRIGIGHPGKNKVINHVLSKPNVEEQNLIDIAINEIIKKSKYLFYEKIEKIFEKINKKNSKKIKTIKK